MEKTKRHMLWLRLLFAGLLMLMSGLMPANAADTYRLLVQGSPSGAGRVSVSGTSSTDSDGAYLVSQGATVTLTASANQNFQFGSWTIDGQIIGTERTIKYQMPGHEVAIMAVFTFNPASPGDPDVPERAYEITIGSKPTGAGSVYISGDVAYTNNKYKAKSGAVVSLQANAQSNFKFKNWTINGEAVSTDRYYDFTMPACEANIEANFTFDPASPGDPDVPKRKFPVSVISKPSGAGSYNFTQTTVVEGDSIDIWAYPYSNFKLKGWLVNGEPVAEASNPIWVKPNLGPVTVTALYDFDPASPANPNSNYWNPTTGQVIIDDFEPGNLYNVLYNLVGYNNLTNVSSIIVRGVMASGDFNALGYLTRASIFDLSHTTGVSSLPSYVFQGLSATMILLPSSITNMGSYVFCNCDNLTSLVVYAQEPPRCTYTTFAQFSNKSNCKLYVPESAVEMYSIADYWRDFTITPITNSFDILQVSPDDPDGWNDLSRPHRITISGDYFNSIGDNCKIEYSVDNSEEWIVVSNGVESGNSFSSTIVALFNPNLPVHTVQLRAVDFCGNISMLSPIVYKDVSFVNIQGIENKTYCWGDSITQTITVYDLDDDQYKICNYKNNINVGTASFNIEGVFPHTIGRKTYSFNIDQLSLSGDIEFTDSESYTYSGYPYTPTWRFTSDQQNSLKEGVDYNILWEDNIYPGTATLHVQGINNFTGNLQNTFIINKLELTSQQFNLCLPPEDITFDNECHSASSTKEDGVGDIIFYYALSGSNDLTSEAPCAIGQYDVYVEIADGSIYFGSSKEKIGSFTIYKFDEDEWSMLVNLIPTLIQKGWSNPWDISGGVTTVSSFEGLRIEKGHVKEIDLSSQGISGSFPVELLSFRDLKSLNISHNALSGELEKIIGTVSRSSSTEYCVERIDISHNCLEGNIGAFAVSFPSLVSLNASNNKIEEVYPKIAPSVNELNLECQYIDQIIEFDLHNFYSDSIDQQIPSILLYNHSTQAYDKPLVLKYTYNDELSIIFSYQNGKFDISNLSDQNVYYGKSGDILNATALSEDGHSEYAYIKMKLNFDQGDANFDGNVNILDLQATILFSFDDYNYSPFNFTAANTFSDDLINVQDVICTVNILLTENGVDVPMNIKNASNDNNFAGEAYVYIEGDELILDAKRSVAAIDIIVDNSVKWDLEQYGFMSASTDNHLVSYSLSGVTLPTGIVKLGEVFGDTQILKCVLSDERAQLIEVMCNQDSSQDVNGINVINGPNDASQVIFDMNGIRLNSLNSGVNIVVNRGGVKKKYNGKK